jgi:RNA polymerase sigma factor (sigma-70 family)
VSVARTDFDARMRVVASRRLEAWAQPADAEGLALHLERLAGADLYLAIGCELGASGAWERFAREYGPRLVGLAVRRGADPAAAESHVADLLTDLASPPPDRGARTLLGTYEGTGSLFGWLALILGRRIARSRRPSREVALPAVESGDGEHVRSTDPAEPAPGPAETVAAAEAAARLTDALREAWTDLTDAETLALLAKYRDDLSQQAIARLLGVSESRVSRVVERARTKLASAIRRRFQRDGAPDAATWQALCAALTEHLSTEVVPVPPPRKDRAPLSPGADP